MTAQTMLIAGAVLIFLAIIVVVGSLVIGAGEPQGVARSLAIIERQITHSEVGKSELPARDRLLTPALDRSRRLGLAFSPKGTSDRLSKMLDVAGNPPDWPVERVLGAKGITMLLFAIVGLLLGGFSLTGVIIAVLGRRSGPVPSGPARLQRRPEAPGPAAYRPRRRARHAHRLHGGRPELRRRAAAGRPLGRGADRRRVRPRPVGDPDRQHPRSGVPGHGRAHDAPEVRTFVSAIVQADRLGLPIANVLREQAKEMRLVRRQRAEEKAQKVPVKILFPMLFCIFPALLVVVIGPGMIRIMGMFAGF